ncbi:ParB/RepB/Spo0J family partition protein [Butyrivibrio sp. LC3010]|uniref:ParB/RepB/Spo0J family partition protein n=1 Tax=Butyrivibrio sp. LC3010 TaxID=1280680 RepID=UPI00040CC5D6|nr:ParB/RepB/Spo0J family partition protein [Butyrivibrio sp. LC3010]
MPKQRIGQKIKLASVEELLGVPSVEGCMDIEVARIHPFKDHPFKVIDDDKMHELVESIMMNGVLVPVIVRQMEDGDYQMIAGHRRLFAVNQIGMDKIPAIVKEYTDDEAILAMVDSNLQREEILPSEKAFAYKMKYEATKRQGKRNDLTSSQLGKKLWADEQLAKEVGESRNQVHRFLRLAELIPPILDLVDRKIVAIVTAVEISYLDSAVQVMLYNYMKENGECKAYQIYALRDYMKDHESITKLELIKILNENAPRNETNKFQKITIPTTKLKEYFPTFYTKSQIENVLFQLLEDWKKENVDKEG